jgi:RNA polymerase-binding protein DksA
MARSTARASRATAKKQPVKKAATSAEKKSPTAKSTAKRSAAKDPAMKKAPAKKAPAGKKAAKQTPAKKALAAAEAAAKKSPAKKSTAKKTTAKKSTGKKAAPKKAAAKQSAAKQAPSKKSAKRASTIPPARKLAVKADEKPWTAKELAEVRGELLAERERLRAELNLAEEELQDLMRDAGDGAGNDQADVGSTTFERDHEMSLANNARDMLEQTEHALVRISNGTYGRCESCGQPIGKMRLMAFPRATLCLTCKQREERR